MNIEQTLMERAKYWYPRVWQREMWQNMLLRVQQNICYESFCKQNICKSDSLCLSLLISGRGAQINVSEAVVSREENGTALETCAAAGPKQSGGEKTQQPFRDLSI